MLCVKINQEGFARLLCQLPQDVSRSSFLARELINQHCLTIESIVTKHVPSWSYYSMTLGYGACNKQSRNMKLLEHAMAQQGISVQLEWAERCCPDNV